MYNKHLRLKYEVIFSLESTAQPASCTLLFVLANGTTIYHYHVQKTRVLQNCSFSYLLHPADSAAQAPLRSVSSSPRPHSHQCQFRPLFVLCFRVVSLPQYSAPPISPL